MVLESSTIHYIQHQIARMDGGFHRGNCLYRIRGRPADWC